MGQVGPRPGHHMVDSCNRKYLYCVEYKTLLDTMSSVVAIEEYTAVALRCPLVCVCIFSAGRSPFFFLSFFYFSCHFCFFSYFDFSFSFGFSRLTLLRFARPFAYLRLSFSLPSIFFVSFFVYWCIYHVTTAVWFRAFHRYHVRSLMERLTVLLRQVPPI